MCGILGICGQDGVAYELVFGLTALQHRGQDAAGIVTFDRAFRIRKGRGLVSQIFREDHIEQLRGSCGLGHVRYATMGSTDVLDAQPVALNYPFGLAMVHNGNVVNFSELRRSLYEEHHRLLDTSNDVALILYTFAAELETKDLKNLSVEDIFDTVEATQNKVQGAYSAIALIANHGFLAFTDPYGIRPLVMGRKFTGEGVVYALASETTCLDYLGYEMMRDLDPGEALFIDAPSQAQRERLVRQKLNPIRDVIRDKKIAVVDDSIVRGTTSKRLVKLLRQSGAREVYFVSASPPIKYPCIYGIDMSSTREIIAAHYDPNQVARYIEADAVVYQTLDDLQALYEDLPCCYACFSGEYPTGVTRETLDEVEREKTISGRL